MCGRYSLAVSGRSELPAALGEIPAFAPRYNIAPQQQAPVLRCIEGKRVLDELTWGFRPAWLKDKNKAQINARAESVFMKPMFKPAALNRRCLVLASGWYEWQPQASGPKLPYAFRLEGNALFAFAGLWTRGPDEDGARADSYAIVTTTASAPAARVHDRMPAVLTGEACLRWLDTEPQRAQELATLLVPYRGEDLDVYRVGTYVNKPANTGPECLRAV